MFCTVISMFNDAYLAGFFIIGVLLAAAMIIGLVSSLREWMANNRMPVLTEEAFVLVRERSSEKRTARPAGKEEKGGIRLPEVSFTWMVTFMTRGHGAVTLELTEAEALIVKEEDQGVLTRQGTRYLGWKKRT